MAGNQESFFGQYVPPCRNLQQDSCRCRQEEQAGQRAAGPTNALTPFFVVIISGWCNANQNIKSYGRTQRMGGLRLQGEREIDPGFGVFFWN
jgi:hypothetical protein